MAEASRKPTFKGYGVKPICGGCGRHLKATEALWFRSIPPPVAVFGMCCQAAAAGMAETKAAAHG